MRRQDLLALSLAGAIIGLAAPPAAAGDLTLVGVISGANPRSTPWFEAFDARLADLGWVDGETVAVEFRDPQGKAELMARFAAELVALDPAVIVATGSAATLRAVRERSGTIPIVIVAVDYDPVELGYVASYARPGGDVTGIAVRRPELNAKRFQLVKETIPSIASVAILGDRISEDQFRLLEAAAMELGLATEAFRFAEPPYDFASPVAEAAATSGAIVTVASPVFFRQRHELFAAAAHHRIPVFFGNAAAAADGALMGFSANLPDMFARAADYVHSILEGASPGDLPIEQADTFELAVNLRVAHALGIGIPPSILLRADEVIE